MNIDTALKQLRLSGLARTLPVRPQEAGANRLTHAEFFELIIGDELTQRDQPKLERRTEVADFRHPRTFEDFDWRFNPSITR